MFSVDVSQIHMTYTSRLGARVFALMLSACAAAPAPSVVSVKIAAINDFHGYLQPSQERISFAAPDSRAQPPLAGGVGRIATLVATLRAHNRYVTFVSSGDLIGASPLISAAFRDEPTIEAMNAAGLDFNGLGNHEFDGGIDELRRMQNGGCAPGGCKAGARFGGARFRFLAANVIETATGRPLFEPYGIRDYGGIKIAFVGVTLKGTPAISSARNVAALEFRDEAEAVNALVPELRREGVEAIVVLIHQGGTTRGGANECVDLRGPIRGIVERLDRAVDVVLSGHTHQAYVCDVDGRLVTSAGSYGRMVTEIDLQIDPRSGDVVSARAVNRLMETAIPEHPRVNALLERYAQLAAPLQRVVGRIAAPLFRRTNADGESRLGQMVADAHLDASRSAGATVAFVNPGGIRAPLAREGDVTFSQVFDLYPFNNTLVTMTLTGAQIIDLLEQQWHGDYPRVLQVSGGFSYEWDPDAAPGSRVVRDSVTIGGERLDPGRAYRVTVNSYLADGGDRFTTLLDGAERTAGPSSRDAIVRYLETRSPLAPPDERRIRRTMRK